MRSMPVLEFVRDASRILTTSASWTVKFAFEDAREREISASLQKTSASSWTLNIAAAREDSESRRGVAEGASFVMASKSSGSMCVRLAAPRGVTANIQACAAETRGRSWAAQTMRRAMAAQFIAVTWMRGAEAERERLEEMGSHDRGAGRKVLVAVARRQQGGADRVVLRWMGRRRVAQGCEVSELERTPRRGAHNRRG